MSTEQSTAAESLSRRGFFSCVGDGLYGAALASLIGSDFFAVNPAIAASAPGAYDLKPKPVHHPPRAKAVIQLFMPGGPSHVDLFDPKPALEKYAGQSPSRDLASEIRAVREAGGLMPSPFKFSKHGQCGLEISELLPHTAKHADDMALIRSMYTTHLAHEAALFIIHTGRMLPGRPSLGAWVVYGLGAENQNLP